MIRIPPYQDSISIIHPGLFSGYRDTNYSIVPQTKYLIEIPPKYFPGLQQGYRQGEVTVGFNSSK